MSGCWTLRFKGTAWSNPIKHDMPPYVTLIVADLSWQELYFCMLQSAESEGSGIPSTGSHRAVLHILATHTWQKSWTCLDSAQQNHFSVNKGCDELISWGHTTFQFVWGHGRLRLVGKQKDPNRLLSPSKEKLTFWYPDLMQHESVPRYSAGLV